VVSAGDLATAPCRTLFLLSVGLGPLVDPGHSHKTSEIFMLRLLGDSNRKGPGRNTLGRSWECS
jgi:hypothetical protein